MTFSLLLQTEAWVISLLLFLLMILSTFAGAKTGMSRKKKFEEKDIKMQPPDIGYLTGLLFFLLAFTFGVSGNRYDARRLIVVEEANDIRTALVCSDMYPSEERQMFRNDFKEYLEARIDFYEASIDMNKLLSADSLTKVISDRLWQHAARLSLNPLYSDATRQMIPSLIAMHNIVTRRNTAEKSKVPESIVWMLFVMACMSAFYAGYLASIKGHVDWLVAIGLCLFISLTILFTLDLDRPRRGFINLDANNQTIINLREDFK